MSRLALWGLVGGGAIVVVVIVFSRRADSPVASPSDGRALSEFATNADAGVGTPPAVDDDAETTPAPSVVAVTGNDGREAVVPTVLAGRVTDPNGFALEKAVVSWVPVPTGLDTGALTRESVLELVRSTSLETTTSAAGEFAFSRSPNGVEELPSVLWISHVAHGARVVSIAAGLDDWAQGRDWTLERADPLEAMVVGADGAGLPEATVEQVGLGLVTEASGTPSELAWLFRRTVVTDPEGRARMAPMPGRQRAVARLGGRESEPWEGRTADLVTLQIAESFQVGGYVTWSPDVPEATVVRITCDSLGADSRRLGTVEAGPGAWGPATVPLGDASEYLLRLEGDSVIPVEHVVRSPDPGELVEVDFDVALGHTLWFRVTDEDDDVLHDAVGTVLWQQGDRRVARTARVRDDGYMPVVGCGDGTVHPHFDCPGYVRYYMHEIELPLPEQGVWPVVMRRAGTLRGTVLFEGTPVDDFDVVVWSPSADLMSRKYAFRDTGDGSFEIDDVTPMDVRVVATAQGFTQSVPTSVSISTERAAEIDLELLPAIRAVGRVIDAATHAPVAHASVTVQVTDGLAALPVEGTVHRAGADGRFDVSGVASGLTAVAVSAPEYSRRQVTGGTPAGDVLDLGTIPLDRRQDLEVVIRHDGLVDPASFALWMRGPDGVRTADADADGRFRFELLSAGSYVFAVRGGGDPASYTESRELAPGDEWRVEVDVSGGVVLNILAIGADGDPVLGGHDIAIDRYLKDGGSGANVNPDANGRARVRVPPGNLQLTLKTRVDAGNVPLATRRLRFDEPGEYDVELRVGEGDRRFRVTDENGDPVAGVRLTCNLGDPFEWCSDGVTDGEGIAVVRGLATAADNARVSLSHAERGIRLSIPVHLGPPTEITAITFEAGVQASFVFTRPGRPAVGARAVLGDTLGLRAIPGPMTDERGRAVFDEIVPGAYRAQILGDDYWPSHRIVTVDGNSTVTVEVFKRCDARVEVTVGGVPASGVAMQLQADDQASPVGKYVADGYVTSSTGSLTTGADGSVVLKGLAEGHYRWSTTAPSGEAVEGVAELDADEENVVRIALPE